MKAKLINTRLFRCNECENIGYNWWWTDKNWCKQKFQCYTCSFKLLLMCKSGKYVKRESSIVNWRAIRSERSRRCKSWQFSVGSQQWNITI